MLICDKRRPRMRGDTNIRPPQGGQIKTAPRLGPRLRRPAWGGTPPTPGLRPWRAFAHRAPAASVIQQEGVPARVRRWRGWATACGCPCPTPSPGGFRASGEIQRGPCRGTAGFGACPRCRAAVGNPAQAVGGQVQPLAAVPAVHGLGEVVHGRPGYRAHLFGRALEKTGVFLGEPRKAVFPGVRKRKRTSCI